MKFFSSKLRIPLILLGLIGGVVLLGAIIMSTPLFAVDFVTKEAHLELGTAPETDPSYYLDGDSWCVNLSYVDTSSVKKNQVGRYPITIYHGFDTFTCYVNVTDTMAPVITSDVKSITITPDKVLSAKNLDLDIQDASEIQSIAFTKITSNKFYTGLPEEQAADMIHAYKNGIEMWAEDFQFSFGGVYVMTIRVTDLYRNSSEINIEVTVDTPPVIEAPTDIYVVTEGDIDYHNYITVWDIIEEDLSSEDATIDSSQVNMATPGVYPVSYTAIDEYGLRSTASSIVHVHTAAELQELINTHVINVEEHVIIGAKNPYDAGYYTKEDITYIQNKMLPTFVHIQNDKEDTFGSGFIIDIDDEFVTIATNEHVITNDLSVEVTFYDGTYRYGAVVASNPEDDIAFIRLPILDSGSDTSLTLDYVKKLRTVHINSNYWDTLINNCQIAICYACIDINGQVWNRGSGIILEKEATRNWNDYTDLNQTIVSFPPVGGSSGSAIFDGYGRLIAMMRGYTDYSTYSETIAVPLCEILDYYEYVFKTRVEYQ